MKKKDVIIIGGGPAGISAAIWLRRLGVDHLLIEKNSKLGGQLHDIHNEIIDYPGVFLKKGIEMQIMFAEQFYKLGCESLLNTEVLSISLSERKIVLKQAEETVEYEYRYLIMAAGAKQKRLGIPGEREMILRGEVYSASADRDRFKGKTVAVVGGGDRAVEGALLLADAGAAVYLIHRSQHFKARNQYLEAVVGNKNVNMLTDTEVVQIHGEKSVSSIDLRGKDGNVSNLGVDAVFIRIGTEPNIELVKDTLLLSEDGFIETNSFGKTSTANIYAIGDICTNPMLSSISASAGQGAIVAKFLTALLKQN